MRILTFCFITMLIGCTDILGEKQQIYACRNDGGVHRLSDGVFQEKVVCKNGARYKFKDVILPDYCYGSYKDCVNMLSKISE